MSSESAPTNGFNLAALVHGDDRADLSAPADHDKLRADAQAASNGDGHDTDGTSGGAVKTHAEASGRVGTDAEGRPTHSSTGAPLDYSQSVPVRPATSVIMLRETASAGLEVFVQHRVTTMDFAAGVVVFPGGRVDPEDVKLSDGLRLDEELLASQLRAWGQTDASTVGLGDSLVAPDTQPAPGDASDTQATQGVRTLLACAIREVEEETGQRIDPALLHPWANLVTPPGRTKRFDTYFFLAAGEELVELTHQTTEATNSEWLGVDALLTGETEGRYRLMRPTLALLTELQSLGSLDAVLAHAADGSRTIESIRPVIRGVH
ncbi:NUDIX hydrolase [Brevibacterium jeotgali]|uniref:NUDIX domain-containing protein n=1 Tax=Brevibacterium jeotgali TaxID=1262550 RepID=A0A2H1L566_9MICO|nr:NUDIX hydrolase [Brevibacterium jeotgali]TWB98515.1 NUDIX domain-containing protein [Brevibacterium jeotgali]SMY12032.1 NUDIX domain-containing protein [Brevibacterium jeotgali]